MIFTTRLFAQQLIPHSPTSLHRYHHCFGATLTKNYWAATVIQRTKSPFGVTPRWSRRQNLSDTPVVCCRQPCRTTRHASWRQQAMRQSGCGIALSWTKRRNKNMRRNRAKLVWTSWIHPPSDDLLNKCESSSSRFILDSSYSRNL